MIYQELNLAPHLSVADNIVLGWSAAASDCSIAAPVGNRAASVGTFGPRPFRFARRSEDFPSACSKSLKSLAPWRPTRKCSIFDEPTSSLARHDVEHLFTDSQAPGRWLIGHLYQPFLGRNSPHVRSFHRPARWQHRGNRKRGRNDQFANYSCYGRREVAELFPAVPHQLAKPSCGSRPGRRMPLEVSFELRRGEILGMAGLLALVELNCFAPCAVRSSAVGPSGWRSRCLSLRPVRRIRAGFGMVSEDRRAEGLAQQRSIADNMTYSGWALRPVGFAESTTP